MAVAFFGGLLFKSWYEERIFERDTRRLLAYYKHVVPGSMSDGDLHNARYLVYKYRNKKEKLWKSLEMKYGEPVLHEHEWSDSGEKEQNTADGGDAYENLDESSARNDTGPEQEL